MSLLQVGGATETEPDDTASSNICVDDDRVRHRFFASPSKENRGQYYLHDEVLAKEAMSDIDLTSNSKNPTSSHHVTSSSSTPKTGGNRRKQSTPHRLQKAVQPEADVIAKAVLSENLSDEVDPGNKSDILVTMKPASADTSSDSEGLVIALDSPDQEDDSATEKVSPKKPQKKKEPESMSGTSHKVKEEKPSPRPTASNKSESGKKTKAAPKEQNTKKQQVKPEESKGTSGGVTSTKKFEDVENAMEAMFAGIEGDADKTTAEQKPTSTKTAQNGKDLSVPKVPKRRGRPPKNPDAPTAGPKRTKKPIKSKLSPQDKLLSKFGSPFVHVTGQWSNVINSSLDPMTPGDSPRSKKGICDLENRKKVDNLGLHHSSTLSTAYDAKRQDQSWLCVFCKKPSHFQGLGDLFGPYFVSAERSTSPPKRKSASEKEMAAKYILGGDAGKKKRKRPSEPLEQDEVWFHEDCLCWMPEITLIGSRLLGLEDAISASEKAICCKCKVTGSTLACLKVGCRQTAHFICATNSSWAIDEENFEAYCEDHRPPK